MYRIDKLADLCRELGLSSQLVHSNEIEIACTPECTLIFRNLPEQADTVIGFKGTPWHGHGTLTLMTGKSTYNDFDELDIVRGLVEGLFVIVSHYKLGVLVDRYVNHKGQPPRSRRCLRPDYLEATS